jgi:glycosyltransferase involved in cell wall biosynthesis
MLKVGFFLKISVAMIVKNEEKYIKRCLESLIELVDEIVIVDTGSTDNTINIIKQFQNIKLYYFEWCDDFSAARNYSIKNTTGEYVLVLDADEYIIDGTRNDLEVIIDQKTIGRILINSDFKKNNQIFQSTAYVSRFFPREVKFVGVIHEQLDSDIPRVNMNITIKHSGYFGTNKSKRNIPLLLKEVNNNPADPYYNFQLGKELRINRQYEEAFHLLKKSYVQSNELYPYYCELVVELINCGKECGKEEVLQIIEQNEEILNNVADFHFAKGLFYMDYSFTNPDKTENYISKIESSFLSCLRLNKTVHIEFLQGTSSYLAAYNLGVYYEVTGNIKRAIECYQLSSKSGYTKAQNRLESFR